MASTPHTPHRTKGAVRLEDGYDENRGKGGLLKFLLPILLLIALIVALLIIGKDDPSSSKGSAAPKASAIKAGGATLPYGGTGALKGHVGEMVSASGLKVVGVNAKDGFLVGTSPAKAFYVEFGGKTGVDEKGTLPKLGDTVTLKAEVRPSPVEPKSALHLRSAATAALIKREGGFLNASSVR